MIKKEDYCCYPYIHSNEWATDFEVLTDGLSSEIGFAYSCQPFYSTKVKKDLKELCKIVLDLNPMIRKFDKKILKESLFKVEEIFQRYKTNFNSFYLPIGKKTGTSISRLRLLSKSIIRLLVKNKNESEELKKVFNLLTNLFHLMWIKTTKRKTKFISKSYV